MDAWRAKSKCEKLSISSRIEAIIETLTVNRACLGHVDLIRYGGGKEVNVKMEKRPVTYVFWSFDNTTPTDHWLTDGS